MAVAKFHAIGDERLNAKVARQRTHDVVEQLPDQHNPLPAANRFQQFLARFLAQIRLQHVLKIFFAEQIEAVAAHPAQQRVQKSRGEGAAGRVRKRPRQRHPGHSEPSRPSLRKTLRIPREKSYRPHRADLQQRSFDAPIHGLALNRTHTRTHTRRVLRNSCRRGKIFAHASETSDSAKDRHAKFSYRRAPRAPVP